MKSILSFLLAFSFSFGALAADVSSDKQEKQKESIHGGKRAASTFGIINAIAAMMSVDEKSLETLGSQVSFLNYMAALNAVLRIMGVQTGVVPVRGDMLGIIAARAVIESFKMFGQQFRLHAGGHQVAITPAKPFFWHFALMGAAGIFFGRQTT